MFSYRDGKELVGVIVRFLFLVIIFFWCLSSLVDNVFVCYRCDSSLIFVIDSGGM